MNKENIQQLLLQYKNDQLSQEELLESLGTLSYEDMEHTKLDLHREIRNGYPEVIFGQGKTVTQLKDIIASMVDKKFNILATHISAEKANEVLSSFPKARYHEAAKCLSYRQTPAPTETEAPILIVTAGTSDLPVAEEAKVTAEMLGHRADIIIKIN